MHLQQLATHLAELDFAAAPYEPTLHKNNRELLQFFEQHLAEGKAGTRNPTHPAHG